MKRQCFVIFKAVNLFLIKKKLTERKLEQKMKQKVQARPAQQCFTSLTVSSVAASIKIQDSSGMHSKTLIFAHCTLTDASASHRQPITSKTLNNLLQTNRKHSTGSKNSHPPYYRWHWIHQKCQLLHVNVSHRCSVPSSQELIWCRHIINLPSIFDIASSLLGFLIKRKEARELKMNLRWDVQYVNGDALFSCATEWVSSAANARAISYPSK